MVHSDLIVSCWIIGSHKPSLFQIIGWWCSNAVRGTIALKLSFRTSYSTRLNLFYFIHSSLCIPPTPYDVYPYMYIHPISTWTQQLVPPPPLFCPPPIGPIILGKSPRIVHTNISKYEIFKSIKPTSIESITILWKRVKNVRHHNPNNILHNLIL